MLPDGRTSQLAKTEDLSSGPACSSNFSWVSGSGREESPGSAVTRPECISQTGLLLETSLLPLQALLQCVLRSLEPTGSRGPFQPPRLCAPGLFASPWPRVPVSVLLSEHGGIRGLRVGTTHPSSSPRPTPGPGAGTCCPCLRPGQAWVWMILGRPTWSLRDSGPPPPCGCEAGMLVAYPALLHSSSVQVQVSSGSLAASLLERKRRIKQLS